MSTVPTLADESASDASKSESVSSKRRSSGNCRDSESTADEVVSPLLAPRDASIAELEDAPQYPQSCGDDITSTETKPASPKRSEHQIISIESRPVSPSQSEERDDDNATVQSKLSDLEAGPSPSPTGIRIEPSYRSSLCLVTLFIIAVVLVAMTIAFAGTSFSQSLIYDPPFFPYSPLYAILILQILATLSLMTMQQCFHVCSEIFRWTLACRGTNSLSFLVISPSTGFSGLMNILITKPGWITAPWRLFAMYKLLVLYIAFIFGQSIWLLAIDSRLTYQIVGASPPDALTIPQSMGFSLSPAGLPTPYATSDVANFIDSSFGQCQGPVSNCTDLNPERECAVNYNVFRHFGLPNLEYSTPMQMAYSVPTIIINSVINRSMDLSALESYGPWAYCLNHTSAIGNYLRMCMGGAQRQSSENTTIVNAGWETCFGCYGDYRNMTSLTATIFLSTAPSTIITSQTGSIDAIALQAAPEPFSVNVTEFFHAFSAPLWINETQELIEQGVAFTVNATDATTLVDGFVDSFSYYLSSLGTSLPASQVFGAFITFILYSNQQSIGPVEDSSIYFVQQANALTISPVSIIGFTLVSAIMLGSSLVMCLAFPKTKRPNMSSYPELAFAGKMTDGISGALKGLSNANDRAMIERLVDVRIQVGEDEDETKVVISTSAVKPLRKDVPYI